jgi:hypothetical protein
MRLSIAYASAKVCRLAIESVDSLDYSVSAWWGEGARDRGGHPTKDDLGEKTWKALPQGLKPSSIRLLYGTAEPVPFVQSAFRQPV